MQPFNLCFICVKMLASFFCMTQAFWWFLPWNRQLSNCFVFVSIDMNVIHELVVLYYIFVFLLTDDIVM